MKKAALQESIFMKNANYRVNEYQLILNPHEELRKKILNVKKDFSEAFEAPSAKWGKPHLTLVRFKQLENGRNIFSISITAQFFQSRISLGDPYGSRVIKR